MSRTEGTFRSVKALVEQGLSDYQIADLTGVPRATMLRWRRRERPPYADSAPTAGSEWRVADPATYAYLLGIYLGDGHVTHRPPSTWVLRVACDQAYPGIIAEVRRAMDLIFPPRLSTQIRSSKGGSDVISICHPGVGLAFPQHGPGRKHLRPILLSDWQLELTHAHPGSLIRGLIHSDGCRVLNRFKTKLPGGRVAQYEYVRYFFSNLSADIRQIFNDHCALLGVRVTQSNHRNLTVSHRNSVAVLERLVGPKT